MTSDKTKQKSLRLSVSSIEAFQSCRAKWYYRYVEKLPSPPTYHLTAGSFIHKILEIYLRRYKKNGGDLRDAASVAYRLAQRDKDIAPYLTEEIKKEGKQWIKEQTLRYESDASLIPDVLHIERPFSFKIEDSNILVRGFIDRIDSVGSTGLRVVDYKTSSNPNYLKPFQLETYAYAMQQKYPDKKIEMEYELVRHKFSSKVFELSSTSYDNVISTFKKVGNEIRELKERQPSTPWEPTVNRLCSYCPFRMRCEKDRSTSPWDR